MTSLEVLWNSNKEKVEELWKKFHLPAPKFFNDITPEERIAILSVFSTWNSLTGYKIAKSSLLMEALQNIDEIVGRKVCEDLLSGIREIEESKLDGEVQQQSVGDFPIADRKES